MKVHERPPYIIEVRDTKQQGMTKVTIKMGNISFTKVIPRKVLERMLEASYNERMLQLYVDEGLEERKKDW